MPKIEDVEAALMGIVAVLDAHDIPYAVMGGLAFRVYALPRATQDVDLTISIEPDDLPHLRERLFESGCEIPAVYDSGWLDRVADMPLFKVRRYIGNQGIDIDLFVAESDYQAEMLRRRQFFQIDGRSVALVSPEDLVLLKVAAGRPRDRIDVQDLLITLGALDEPYLRKWGAELGIADKLEEALRELDF